MCFSPNILLEPGIERDKSRKFPEHLLEGKHCTLTPHVKATDFAFSFFVRGRCAPAKVCVAMQRDAGPKCRKTPAIGLPGMLLGWRMAQMGCPTPAETKN
jgi:hypothetical protein